MSINYRSIEDARCPPTPGLVRAESPHSLWRFRSIPACAHTEAATEAFLRRKSTSKDSSGSYKMSLCKRLLHWVPVRRKPTTPKTSFEISVKFVRRLAQRKPPDVPRVCPIKQQVLTPFNVSQSDLAPLKMGLLLGTCPGTEADFPPPLPPPSTRQRKAARTKLTSNRGLATMQCAPSLEDHADVRASSVEPNQWRGVGTIIEFESVVDSKGSIPAWFINHMQRCDATVSDLYIIDDLRFVLHILDMRTFFSFIRI